MTTLTTLTTRRRRRLRRSPGNDICAVAGFGLPPGHRAPTFERTHGASARSPDCPPP